MCLQVVVRIKINTLKLLLSTCLCITEDQNTTPNPTGVTAKDRLNIKECIKEVFRKNFVRLKNVIEQNLEGLGPRFYTAKMITDSVYKEKTFQGIYDSFIEGLDWLEDDIVEYCETFFGALKEEGGPLIHAARSIKKQINECAANSMNNPVVIFHL